MAHINQTKKIYMSRLFIVIAMFICICIIPAFAQTSGTGLPSNEDSRVTVTKQRYNFDTWPLSRARYNGLCLRDLRFSSYHVQPVDFVPKSPVILSFAGEDDINRFLIEITIRDSVAEAREKLVEYLTFISSTKLMPTTNEKGIHAGDIGFVGISGSGNYAWITFVTGNICIRVVCLDPRVQPSTDLGYLAEKIDGVIRSQPKLASGAELSHPVISVFSADKGSYKAGDIIPLNLQVSEPSGKPETYKWVIGNSGQGYVEMDKQGQWNLHTTKSGIFDVTCYVLGPTGTYTSKAISLTVADK
jgi:hypothetical protein